MTRQHQTLQSRLARRLEREPTRPTLTFVDRRGRFQWKTFAEVYEEALRSGVALVENGLRPGDVCILVLHSDPFCATALMATLLVGGVPLLVAPPVLRGLHSNLADVLRHVVRQTEARIVIAGVEAEEIIAELRATEPKTRLLVGADALVAGDAERAVPVLPGGESVAALQLTSGTTGFPRICEWSQRGVLAALEGMAQAMQIRSDDICVNWTPLYHDMGLVNNFLFCLVQGTPLAMLVTFDFLKRPALWLRALSSTRATMTWSPNFGFALTSERVRDEELEGVRLDRVRAFWNAAERIHYRTMLDFHARFAPLGVEIDALKTNFGCAENVGGATFSDPNGRFLVEHLEARSFFESQVANPVAADAAEGPLVSVVGVGQPYRGMSVRILSPNGRALGDGRIGEIALDTPSRMNRYLGNRSETRRALRRGLLKTGDLGYLRGNELFWVGRVRERINLRGKKYDPSDFEKALLQVAGLREGCFAAFGVDDEELGTQRLIIVTEVRDSNDRPHQEILDEIRESLTLQAGVEPDEIVLLPQGSMTKTSSGKRRHRFYRQVYQGGQLEPLTRWPQD